MNSMRFFALVAVFSFHIMAHSENAEEFSKNSAEIPSNEKSACGKFENINSDVIEKLKSFETYRIEPISELDPKLWLFLAAKSGHPEINPPKTIPIFIEYIKLDMIRRSVYATCDLKYFYFLEHGGVIDQYIWYGPISIIDILK